MPDARSDLLQSPLERKRIEFDAAEIIVGLEVHVQLKTRTKLFCGCSTVFGASPNTQSCPICTGMPGALPVLNSAALRLAVKTGLALNCDIARYTKWDRKNYFYPDLPKGYQTSQFDQPICSGGYLDVVDPRSSFQPCRVRLQRAHLEEDAGKSMHDESGQGRASKIDLNRAGTPLLEIVTQPDLRSAAQAKGFLQELKLVLTYLGVSDCNMQEGSLRCDANVNLHIAVGSEKIATPIVEIKNLNSFRAVERAIQAEAQRQFSLWQATGQTISEAPKQTRGWDDQANETFLQREKEDSADYRYFPCPDLIAYRFSEDAITEIQEQLETLPGKLRAELISEFGLKLYDADVLVSQGRGVVDFFLKVTDQMLGGQGSTKSKSEQAVSEPSLPSQDAKTRVGKIASNWIGQEVLRYLNEQHVEIDAYPLKPEVFADFLDRVRQGELDQARSKEVLNLMLDHNITLNQAIERLGIVNLSADDLNQLVSQLIQENPSIVQQIRDGNAKAIGALIGKAKQLNPNANPALVKDLVLTRIK